MSGDNDKDICDSLILVVDDSTENLLFLTKLLSKRGFRVDKAANGEEALALAESNPPDLILLDIQMPGINGFEICRRLKQNPALSYIPVIFLSALNDMNTKMQAFRGGGVDFVGKPFHLDEILVRVQTHLRLVRVEELKREIEERKRAEAEVRRLNDELENRVRLRTNELLLANTQLRKFHRAIEHSPTTVVITNRHGEIEYVNPKFTETTGFLPEEVLGQNPRVLNSKTQPPGFYRTLWETITAGNEWRGEFCNRKKNGDLYWESAAISPIWNDHGEITHYVALKSDITELRQATEEMKKAKESAEIANKTKSVFLANMSHEIRTPLNAILGYTQILQGDAHITTSQKKTLSIVGRSGEHLLALINDILEMSKIEAGQNSLKSGPFDLHALLSDLKAMFLVRTKTKAITLDLSIDSTVPRHVVADEGKLRQVIINLLGNAVKFTDQGGIAIRLKHLEELAGRRIKVEVEDTGSGIPEKDLTRIFNPFEQASISSIPREGTGLGLSISREFVRLMGGELRVQSQVGKGSLFSFVIPVGSVLPAEMPVRKSEPAAMQETLLSQAWRILVVDDVDLNREMLAAMLTNAHYTIKQACNGREAVEICAAWKPHLVLMDLQMPVMDGYTAMRTIRSSSEHARTILIPVTACTFEEDLQEAKAAGADDFIRKPFKEKDLLETISIHLKTVQQADGEDVSDATNTGKCGAADKPENQLNLPDAWVVRMREAMLDGDIFTMNELIDRIHAEHPGIARRIRHLAENYEYEKIERILKH